MLSLVYAECYIQALYADNSSWGQYSSLFDSFISYKEKNTKMNQIKTGTRTKKSVSQVPTFNGGTKFTQVFGGCHQL
jgi:hypothetical protein